MMRILHSRHMRALGPLLFLLAIIPAHAQAPRQDQVRQMNAELRGAGDRASLLPILERRQNAIIEMLENEPANVRAVMLDAAESRRILAAAPEAAQLLESEGTWDGELEKAIQDDFSSGASATRFYFRSGSQKIRILNNPGFPPATNKFCPQPMRVSGLKAGDVLQASSAQAMISEAAVSCSSVGDQKTAVFLLNYPSRTLNADWTVANANSIIFGASNSVASYVSEVSHNKATLSGQVYGPYTVDTNFTCFEDPGNIAAAVIRVIGNSINLRTYQHLFFIVPTASDCAAGSRGISSVGCWTITLADGGTTQLSVSQASVSPTQAYTTGRHVYTHEYGHGLGVSHAASISFPGTALGGLTVTGTKDEYGDLLSVMGIAQIGHMGAPHLDELSWLDPAGVTTVSTTGIHQLKPLESAANDTPKALKIQRPGTTRHLWVEYRQPIGFDAGLTARMPSVFDGVIVHYQNPPGVFASDLMTHLLDFHPGTNGNFSDAPLLAGETWIDPSSSLRLTVGTATSSGIFVTVTLGTSCTYSLGPGSGTTVQASGGGGSITVTTQSGCAWSASSNASWLSITGGFSGSGSGTTQFLAAANSGAQRSANITIAGQTYTVTQAAFTPTCTYSLGPGSSTNVSASGAVGSISVTTDAGCAWTSSSNAGWLSITGGFSGSGPGTVSFIADLNTTAARSASITIAGQIYTVNQDAGTCSYVLSPGSGTNVTASGGTGTITVTAPAHCGWSASSNSTWLIITSGFSGSGSALVQYTVQTNFEQQRIGTITIAGQIFTVTQASGATSATPSNSLTLSQFVGGGTEWRTTLFLTNLSSSPENFTLRFYDDNGAPTSMPIESLGMVSSFSGTLAPGQTQRYETGATPDKLAAWALLTPGTLGANRLSGLAVFRQTIPSGTSEAVVDLTPITTSKYVMLFDNVSFATAAAFANPDPSSSLVILADIRDDQGTLLATDSITLQPLGHTAFELYKRFPSTIDRRGSIRFSASPKGFTGLGLRFSPFNTFTSFRFLTSADIQ